MGEVVARDEAVARREIWGAAGERVVVTNGVFDLFHRGHADALAAARGFGRRLVVGLNDDASVRRLKGAGRPLVPLEDRAAVLAALAAVDLVVPFAEDTPEALIRALRPDVLVKGADYRPEDIVGGPFVESYGGCVERIELTPGHSTSALVRKIVEAFGVGGAGGGREDG